MRNPLRPGLKEIQEFLILKPLKLKCGISRWLGGDRVPVGLQPSAWGLNKIGGFTLINNIYSSRIEK